MTRIFVMTLLLLFAPGCVHIYHPMSGFHDPVLVDPAAPNLEGVRLTIHCVPEGYLNQQGANKLCRRTAILFENQGAQVTTISTVNPYQTDDSLDEPSEDANLEPTDLWLELRARRLHQSNNPLMWAACLGTLTLFPAVTDTTFVQDVEVRDATGFLLLRDTFEGRVVRLSGVGAWGVHGLLDWIVRPEEDDVMGLAASRDLSGDLYRQLSQMVFNAKLRWQVMQEGAG